MRERDRQTGEELERAPTVRRLQRSERAGAGATVDSLANRLRSPLPEPNEDEADDQAPPASAPQQAPVDDGFDLFCAPASPEPTFEAVQAHGTVQLNDEAVLAQASHGVQGAGQALPHLASIQGAFGPDHDLGSVRAHIGGPAAEASEAIGADAYATGRDVAFASAPDVRLAAHEAAHVVQQRAGVHLSGGVGRAGDPYEQHADAVAARVVSGQSAADLLGPGAHSLGVGSATVQRQASPTLDVKVSWSSPFGNDFSGEVTLEGSPDKKAWTVLGTQTVALAGDVTFTGVAHHKFFRAKLNPSDDDPNQQAAGQFKNTTLTSGVVQAGANSAAISGGLELNRWNPENVRQRHASKGFKPDKTDEKNVRHHDLFGRRVRVHDLLAPRVAATNARYLQLSPTDQAEIQQSIFVMGGYAYRNQVGHQGHYSNHSVGTAIDVNYNEGKLQNALVDTREELRVLNELFEPIANLDPAFMGSFDVWKSTGQDQLAASKAFNRQFPLRLAELLGRTDYVLALRNPHLLGIPVVPIEQLREMTGAELVKSVTPAMLDAAIKTAKGRDLAMLTLIKSHWSSLVAWVVGTNVTDDHSGEKDPADPTGKRKRAPEGKIAKGMIPIDERVLQLFLDTGWSWGGDWDKGTRKDYMHFEDPTIEPLLKI
jgi:hypothetical protein